MIRYDPNAIAVYDNELRYVFVSERYLNDYGIQGKDIIGKHHYEVFPEMPQRWKEVHQRVWPARSSDRTMITSSVRMDRSRTTDGSAGLGTAPMG